MLRTLAYGLWPLAVREVFRLLDPVRIGVVREDEAAALDAIDHFVRDAFAKRGTTPAAAETALRAGELVADVRGAVHHDRALERAIVEPAIETVPTKRVAVLPDIRVFGDVQPHARAMR